MTETKQEHDDPIHRGLDELKALGRELGVRIKDASADVKEAWQKLQPGIAKADELATDKTKEFTAEVRQKTGAVIDDLKAQLHKLREKLDA